MTDKWDRRFLELAKLIASWSKDPSTQVGAVLVNADKIVVGMGYNGFPRGVEDRHDRLHDRPTKYRMVVHAEVNAVLNAGRAAKGATLYIWPSFGGAPNMCSDCAKVVIQAGVAEAVSYEHVGDPRADWEASLSLSRIMADEAGVNYRTVKE